MTYVAGRSQTKERSRHLPRSVIGNLGGQRGQTLKSTSRMVQVPLTRGRSQAAVPDCDSQ